MKQAVATMLPFWLWLLSRPASADGMSQVSDFSLLLVLAALFSPAWIPGLVGGFACLARGGSPGRSILCGMLCAALGGTLAFILTATLQIPGAVLSLVLGTLAARKLARDFTRVVQSEAKEPDLEIPHRLP